MAVVLVRQLQTGDQRVIALHETVGNGTIHQVARAFQLLQREIRAVFQKALYPLAVYAIGPFRPEQAARCELHQEVS